MKKTDLLFGGNWSEFYQLQDVFNPMPQNIHNRTNTGVLR